MTQKTNHQFLQIEAAKDAVRERALQFLQERNQALARERLQAELGISHLAAERVLAGNASRPVLARMLAAWGWSFARFVPEPLCGKAKENTTTLSNSTPRHPRDQTNHKTVLDEDPTHGADGLIEYSAIPLDVAPFLHKFKKMWNSDKNIFIEKIRSHPDGTIFLVSDNIIYEKISNSLPLTESERRALIHKPINTSPLPVDFIATAAQAAGIAINTQTPIAHKIKTRLRGNIFSYNRAIFPNGNIEAAIIGYKIDR